MICFIRDDKLKSQLHLARTVTCQPYGRNAPDPNEVIQAVSEGLLLGAMHKTAYRFLSSLRNVNQIVPFPSTSTFTIPCLWILNSGL